jgi:hypothetical protein
VHLGAAWADVRSENDGFHEALDEAASFVTRSGPQLCPISERAGTEGLTIARCRSP